MAKQGISTGTTPNDGAGDTLLSGAEKIISNFDEIYTLLGDGNNLSSGVVNSIIAGSGISISNSSGDVTVNNIGIAQTANIKSDTVIVTGVVTATSFTGNVTGNVTGGVTGDLTGNVTGDVTGNISGTAGGLSGSPNITVNELISTTLSNNDLNVTGVSTFAGLIDANGLIEATSGENKIPSLYSTMASLPDAGTYHGMFAHVHETGKAYYAHAGAWIEIVNKEVNSVVGTGTESYNVGTVNATSFIGDGSGLTGITGSGTGIVIKHDGSTVGTAGTIDFSTNLDVSAISAGVVTVTASGSGGGGSSGFAEVAGIATYTSEWSLGADGINNYTFTGPGLTGAESDPPIYLTRGQQYKFTNNMNAHPFRIQSTANGSTGTQYNDGILSNDVSNGTLTWDVQFDAPNELYYQCTAHPNMGGKIHIVPRTEPAVGSRSVVSATTGSVSAGSTTNLNINGFKSYGLLKVGISNAAWVRLYVDAASRTSDAARSHLVDPSPGSGLIAEVRSVSTGSTSFLMTPGVIGWNNNVSVGSTIYTSVTNNESSATTITVDLTVVKLED